MFQRCVALKIFVANRLCNIALKRETSQLRLSQFQDCPSSLPPRPGHMLGICHLVGPSGRGLSENLWPGVGHL